MITLFYHLSSPNRIHIKLYAFPSHCRPLDNFMYGQLEGSACLSVIEWLLTIVSGSRTICAVINSSARVTSGLACRIGPGILF